MRKAYYIILLSLFLVQCKSKQDWRIKYNEEKNKKSTTKNKQISENKSVVKKATTSSVKTKNDIANLIYISPTNLKNDVLVNEIIDWYGVPYQFGGNTQSGVDCSGFVNHIYKKVYQIDLPRQSKIMAENITRKYTKDLKEGDLVFFAFGSGEQINHVGIYLHNNKFVHASRSHGVLISDITEPWYGNYLVRCGSWNIDKTKAQGAL